MQQLNGYDEIKKCLCCDGDTFVQLTHAEQVNYFQCQACSVIFLNPQPRFETLKDQYTRPGIIEHGPASAWFNHNKVYLRKIYQERLDDLMRWVNGGTLLDVGCGMGDFCGVARDAGFQVFGTELSDDYAEHTKKTVGLKEVFIGRFQDLDFSNQAFDAISLWHVFEHVSDPLDLLQLLKGHLTKGGVIGIEVPNVDNTMKRPMYQSDIEDYPLNQLEHLFYYSGLSLRNVCERMGFTVLDLKYVDSPQPAKNVVKHLLRQIKYPAKRLMYFGREQQGFAAVRIYLTV